MANVIFFYIFCLFVLPYEIREKIFEGTPPLAPPCFKKSGPPLLKKKLDPLPWAFGARPRMLPAIPVVYIGFYFAPFGFLQWGLILFELLQSFLKNYSALKKQIPH